MRALESTTKSASFYYNLGFVAGADAMLEVLKNEETTAYLKGTNRVCRKGWYPFIPDDDNKE